jgi:antitoxin VapB
MLWHRLTTLERSPVDAARHVRLFRNGRNQALRIPRGLELDADEAMLHRDGDRLIVEPIPRKPALDRLLAGWSPLEEDLPDLDEGLLPLDDIRL